MDGLFDALGQISSILWGPYTFFVLMGAGILFTIWTKFSQFKAMTHGIQVVRGVYDDPSDPGAISHFQALAAALSATVGLGNIGGVALAIGAGGPGALFWMWIIGFLGMALKTAEITLAMMYRNTDDPENPSGGAMWVVDKTLGKKGGGYKKLARGIGIFFCITLVISTITGGNMFQSWNVTVLTQSYFGVPKIVTGLALAFLIGLVIVGGIKRIGYVAGKLVPFMCLLYIVCGLAVLAMHITEIPKLLALVVESAFSKTQATGAFLGGSIGWAFSQGLRRALFSNEAGQGSAPIAHAAAKTGEPAREGIVGGIGPFIDTICICTLTALVILSTGTWNRKATGELKGALAISRLTETPGKKGKAGGLPIKTGGGVLKGKARKANVKYSWKIQASQDLSVLPKLKGEDPWKQGDTLFMVARVLGAKSKATGSDRIQLKGVIEAPKNNKALRIKWKAVKLKPQEWEGTPTGLALINKGVYRKYEGAQLTALAFDREFPGLGKWLVTIVAWLFALSTMISWSYYGEQGIVYMIGSRGVLPYKLIYLVLVVVAAVAITDTSHMETLMDLGTGAMLWSNLPIVIGLGFLAVRCIDDYFKRLKSGEIKRHDRKGKKSRKKDEGQDG